jgi:chemotaxis response regulator CheB
LINPTPDESEEMPEPAAKGTTSIPVAGIGGSAGGLEVFKHLLADLPADTGLAIVFVQHLDPKHHSLLREILVAIHHHAGQRGGRPDAGGSQSRVRDSGQ